jgi:hypothetical protein
MSLEEQILLTLRSTQVFRLLLVGSYLPILSVLYSVVYIIVSPFVIYCLAIAVCVFGFTDCEYLFDIFKLCLYLHLNFLCKEVIKWKTHYKTDISLCMFYLNFTTTTLLQSPIDYKKQNQWVHNWSRKHGHILEANGGHLCSIPRKLFLPIDQTNCEEISFLCLTDNKL